MAAEVKTFDFELPTRIRFGAGVVKSVGEEARSLGAEHILIITDPGIVKAGIVDRILEALKEEGYEIEAVQNKGYCLKRCSGCAGRERDQEPSAYPLGGTDTVLL